MYTLNGALLLVKADGLTMVATNGHRLALAEYRRPQAVEREMRMLIPRKALTELNHLLSSCPAEQITFAQDDTALYFGLGTRLLACRQLTGRFPAYEAILPKGDSHRVVVSRDEMATALRRVTQFCDERSNCVRVRVAANELRLSSSSAEAGESEDSVSTTYSGPARDILFNAQYLLDFLEVVDTERVRLEYKDQELAGELRPDDEPNSELPYRYVLMPLKGRS